MHSQKNIAIFVFLILFCQVNPIFASARRFIPNKPTLSSDHLDNVRYFSDILRIKNAEIDEQLNDPALTAVTTEFGPTVLEIQNFPFRSSVAESLIKPWSSWWYPKKDNWMFNNTDKLSTLAKYDLVRKGRYDVNSHTPPPGSAADYERNNYNPNALSWEGLCDAWALASLSWPEPKRPVTIMINNKPITFNVSELKALLLKTYEAVDDKELTYYGQKFTGDFDGWIYPDIFPEQFHRFLEVELFQDRQAFIMDHDPGIQIWNSPVFKANYLMDSIPNEPNSVFVRTWLYSAEPTRANNEFVGTIEVVREYDYVLSGTRDQNGKLVITSGYWVKGPDGTDSRQDHPDYITRLPKEKKLLRKSYNLEIDVKIVDEILTNSY